MASVCHADRGAAVMKVCGSASPNGPLLVTSQYPLDSAAAPGQRLLVVNLSTTPPEALREVLAAYRKQILRKDFADRADLDGWRLWAVQRTMPATPQLSIRRSKPATESGPLLVTRTFQPAGR